MSHVAKRLAAFAKNKVIHAENVLDPVLKRFITDPRFTAYIRDGLKRIDTQYELLIPYMVDDEESQLKRFIQYNLGTIVNLTTLRLDYSNYYKRLFKYGSPSDTIRRWGLTPVLEYSNSEDTLLDALRGYCAQHDGMRGIASADPQLYRSLLYFSNKNGMTVSEYVTENGLNRG